jgi:hypothetical protein
VAEWFKAPVLKTGVPKGTGGSNPSPTALHQRRCAAMKDNTYKTLDYLAKSNGRWCAWTRIVHHSLHRIVHRFGSNCEDDYGRAKVANYVPGGPVKYVVTTRSLA